MAPIDRVQAYPGEPFTVSNKKLFALYRIKVVRTMLRAGIPLSKIDQFRDLLEEHAFALTSDTTLRQLLSFLHCEELNDLKRKIADKSLSIISDGTTHVCEAMVIVARYITDDWEIIQRVCRLMR